VLTDDYKLLKDIFHWANIIPDPAAVCTSVSPQKTHQAPLVL